MKSPVGGSNEGLEKDPEEMNNLADPNGDGYDEKLLAAMNAKLNALIASEIGEDKALFTFSE